MPNLSQACPIITSKAIGRSVDGGSNLSQFLAIQFFGFCSQFGNGEYLVVLHDTLLELAEQHTQTAGIVARPEGVSETWHGNSSSRIDLGREDVMLAETFHSQICGIEQCSPWLRQSSRKSIHGGEHPPLGGEEPSLQDVAMVIQRERPCQWTRSLFIFRSKALLLSSDLFRGGVSTYLIFQFVVATQNA